MLLTLGRVLCTGAPHPAHTHKWALEAMGGGVARLPGARTEHSALTGALHVQTCLWSALLVVTPVRDSVKILN